MTCQLLVFRQYVLPRKIRRVRKMMLKATTALSKD
jgi:hypothetical protein